MRRRFSHAGPRTEYVHGASGGRRVWVLSSELPARAFCSRLLRRKARYSKLRPRPSWQPPAGTRDPAKLRHVGDVHPIHTGDQRRGDEDGSPGEYAPHIVVLPRAHASKVGIEGGVLKLVEQVHLSIGVLHVIRNVPEVGQSLVGSPSRDPANSCTTGTNGSTASRLHSAADRPRLRSGADIARDELPQGLEGGAGEHPVPLQELGAQDDEGSSATSARRPVWHRATCRLPVVGRGIVVRHRFLRDPVDQAPQRAPVEGDHEDKACARGAFSGPAAAREVAVSARSS